MRLSAPEVSSPATYRPAPGSRDYQVFMSLMDKNREVADQIESAWETKGLPTFKSFLREDLARRKNASSG